MRANLEKELCEQYPKIFAERKLPASKTAMCWGISTADGWYDLLDSLCFNIQNHIDWTRKQRNNALRFNRALRKALTGDKAPIYRFFGVTGKDPIGWARDRAEEAIAFGKTRAVPTVCPQVVATQIKEKFGTLRFYYSGGDNTTDGMVRMAEVMSERICEECGDRGKVKNDGWVRVLCEKHAPIPSDFGTAEPQEGT